MPSRYVREGIITSESVCALSFPEEVFYRRLLNKVDDFGRFTAHPSLLRAALYPLQLDKVREADITRWIAACEKVRLLFVYHIVSKDYLVLNKWEQGRAANSKYPEPPQELREKLETLNFIASGGKFPSCPKLGTHDPDSDSDSDSDSDKKTAGEPAFFDGKEVKKTSKRGLSPSKEVIHSKEFERVEKAMNTIRSSYDPHSSWSEKDKMRFNELKVRKGELMEILEIKV